MPSGFHLSLKDKRLIHHFCLVLAKSPEDIYYELFNNNPNIISLHHLKRICSNLLNNETYQNAFLSDPLPITGRNKLLTEEEMLVILQTADHMKFNYLHSMWIHFKNLYYDDINNNNYDNRHLSYSTFTRTINKFNITKKTIVRYHHLRSAIDGYEYLVRISHVNPMFLVDIDETSNSPQSFLFKEGWSLRGELCERRQIIIGTKSFSTIAAFTPLGYLCWNIYEGTITHVEFIEFINIQLRPLLIEENYIIIDNARTHHHGESRAALEDVCNGQYYFVPPYSPHLKPVERGFSLVKKRIRDNERLAIINPTFYINEAFEYYRIGSDHSVNIRNYWNGYMNNHYHYLRDL